MAEVSINHLKPNDFIYVWDRLTSRKTTRKDGDLMIFYQFIVKQINYVAQNAEVPAHQQPETLDFQGEDGMERGKNRLHLWQVFFTNPYEWNDFRKTKEYTSYPDFKYKKTGEALRLSPYDPCGFVNNLSFLILYF